MNEQITVMLVDDQQLVRGGLKMLINSQPDLQVVLEADDGAAAVDSYARMAEEGTAPQVVLMDVRMPIMDGLGMRERITMYGGTLHYGPDLQGGFSVKAWLPYRET